MSVFDVGSTLNYLIELSKCVWQAADKSSLSLSRKALLSWLLQRNRVAQLMNKKTGVINGRSKMMRGKNLANPVTSFKRIGISNQAQIPDKAISKQLLQRLENLRNLNLGINLSCKAIAYRYF